MLQTGSFKLRAPPAKKKPCSSRNFVRNSRDQSNSPNIGYNLFPQDMGKERTKETVKNIYLVDRHFVTDSLGAVFKGTQWEAPKQK